MLIECKWNPQNIYLSWTNTQWAIPEINGTPPKKTWDSQILYSFFAVGIPPKIIFFIARRVKKTWEFPFFLLISALYLGIPKKIREILLVFFRVHWEF